MADRIVFLPHINVASGSKPEWHSAAHEEQISTKALVLPGI